MFIKMIARTDKTLKEGEATFEVQQRSPSATERLAEALKLFVASESQTKVVEVNGTQVTLSYNSDNDRFEVLDEDGEVISWNDCSRDFVKSASFIIAELA